MTKKKRRVRLGADHRQRVVDRLRAGESPENVAAAEKISERTAWRIKREIFPDEPETVAPRGHTVLEEPKRCIGCGARIVVTPCLYCRTATRKQAKKKA